MENSICCLKSSNLVAYFKCCSCISCSMHSLKVFYTSCVLPYTNRRGCSLLLCQQDYDLQSNPPALLKKKKTGTHASEPEFLNFICRASGHRRHKHKAHNLQRMTISTVHLKAKIARQMYLPIFLLSKTEQTPQVYLKGFQVTPFPYFLCFCYFKTCQQAGHVFKVASAGHGQICTVAAA